jgi:hypothetical protein
MKVLFLTHLVYRPSKGGYDEIPIVVPSRHLVLVKPAKIPEKEYANSCVITLSTGEQFTVKENYRECTNEV